MIGGRDAILLLIVTIIASDSAQYYTGRALGRRRLAPAISPSKTVEGAIGGLVLGTAAMTLGGLWVFKGVNIWLLLATSVAVVALGMVGDLFESLLKRSAGVKDSSTLIPGHGGVLDRIDSWLFAGTGLLRLHPVPAGVMKRVAILGSTGSIGQSALAVVAAHPDRLRVVALSAGENVPRFVEQVAQYAPDTVAMATSAGLAEVQAGLRSRRRRCPRRRRAGRRG